MNTTRLAMVMSWVALVTCAIAQDSRPAAPAEPAPSAAGVTFVTNVTAVTNLATVMNASTGGSALVVTNGEKGLRLNFRGVPLDMVLNYMSDAAGFIIVLETEVRGMVDVWSNEPLSKQEAVDLLNTVLARNGYAAIRNGRTLRIISREDAKKKDIPVKSGADPEAITKTEEMVIQVVPVRHANATQLTQNLQPLLPTYAEMTANESGNALVITATETDVRRMVEIVKALDTSISSVSTVRVFPLRYADAKELANTIKELFQPAQQQNTGGRQMNAVFNPFGGGGPGGNFGGRGGGGGGGRTASGNSSVANTRVTAVGDEASNSLIVGAPEDVIPTIEALIKDVDVEVADVTELRVFHLNNADPTEMSTIFADLFPDETRTGQQQQGGVQFRGPFGLFGNRGGNNRGNSQANGSSDRKLKKGRVMAVPDPRTRSLIVSAAREMMPEIEQMIEQLDGNAARKQKVYVYDLENADVQRVQQVLQDMFQRENTGNRNSANQNSALMNRSAINNQAAGNNGVNNRSGNSGFGNNNNSGSGQAFR